MKLKAALLAVTSAFFLLLGSNAFAVITLNLTFDNDSLAPGTTGTFSLSGSATSTSGTNSGWTTSSGGLGTPATALSAVGDGSYFGLNVVTLDTLPGVTYNSAPFTLNMVGTSLLSLSNDSFEGSYNSLSIGGSSTFGGALFQIGNGTTDFVSGTFIVQYSNLGTFATAGLSGSFGSSNGTFTPNVDLIAGATTAVPEPSTYAVVAGLVILGFAAGRRRRGRPANPVPARKPKVILLDA